MEQPKNDPELEITDATPRPRTKLQLLYPGTAVKADINVGVVEFTQLLEEAMKRGDKVLTIKDCLTGIPVADKSIIQENLVMFLDKLMYVIATEVKTSKSIIEVVKPNITIPDDIATRRS